MNTLLMSGLIMKKNKVVSKTYKWGEDSHEDWESKLNHYQFYDVNGHDSLTITVETSLNEDEEDTLALVLTHLKYNFLRQLEYRTITTIDPQYGNIISKDSIYVVYDDFDRESKVHRTIVEYQDTLKYQYQLVYPDFYQWVKSRKKSNIVAIPNTISSTLNFMQYGKSQAQIISSNGRLVANQKCQAGMVSISLENLAQGNYFLVLYHQEGRLISMINLYKDRKGML